MKYMVRGRPESRYSVRDDLNPERQIESDYSEHEEGDLFNPYASQTDSYDYDSEDLVDSNHFDVSKITSVATDEDKTDSINQEWAEIHALSSVPPIQEK